MTETIARVATHGKGRRALDRALNAREPFRTGGALQARRYEAGEARLMLGTHPGELSGADLGAWRLDVDDVVYVVMSYATPIGWLVDDGTARGRFVRVQQRFSVTTSKHQGTLWAAEQPAGYFDGWL